MHLIRMVSEKYHQVGFHCICTKSSSVGIKLKVPIPPLCTVPGVVSFVCILPERPPGMYASVFRHPRNGGFREVSDRKGEVMQAAIGTRGEMICFEIHVGFLYQK